MGIFNLFRKKSRTLIVADDNQGLWGIVTDGRSVSTDNHFSKDTDLKAVLTYGKKHKAKSVLFLQVSDVREIEVKLGPGLDAEERHTAIEYAAESNLGDHEGFQRISYMDGMLHDFRSGILISAFDTEDIQNTAQTVKAARMKFRGYTNFKQLLMSEHFSDPEHHECAFLFLLGTHGFVAVPEHGKLQVRNLPFGVPDAGEDKQEWLDRIGRRLIMLKHRKTVLLSPGATPELCQAIQDITEAEEVQQADWEDALLAAAAFYLNDGAKLIHPALPPPKPRDPKAPGTWMGFLMIILTVLSLGFLWCRNTWTMYQGKQELERLQEIEGRVKAERTKLAGLEKSIAAERTMFSIMKKKERVSKNLLVVINLLQRFPLQYTRAIAITEQLNGIFIEGESVWQPDLSGFLTNFETELNKYGLGLFSDGLNKEKDGRITFRFHVKEGVK